MHYLNLLVTYLLHPIYHLFSQSRSQVFLFFRYYYLLFSLFSIIILFLLFNLLPLIPINSSQTKGDLWLSCVKPTGLNANVKFFHYHRIIRIFLLIILMKAICTHFILFLLVDSAIFGQITVCHQEIGLLSRCYFY